MNHLGLKAWSPGCPYGTRPIDLVVPNGQISEPAWKESQDVLSSVVRSLNLTICRMWMTWNPDIINMIQDTKEDCESLEDTDSELGDAWRNLVKSSRVEWDGMVNSKAVVSEDLDKSDVVEQDVLVEDEDPVIREDMLVHVGESEGHKGNLDYE